VTAPAYPAPLEAASWSALMAPHKAALAKARLKVDLGDTLKALARAHAAVDWDLFGIDGLDTAEDATRRQADLDAERTGPVKALLKLAAQARAEAAPLVARFKAEPALNGDAARRAAEIAAAADALAGAVDDALDSAAKALEKRRSALLAAAARAPAPAVVDPKVAKVAATVRARLVAGLRAVRKPLPGQPPMKFIAGVVAGRARLVVGTSVGNTQKMQLMALLPQQDGIKWLKGDCLWQDQAVTFVCAGAPSGVGRRLQRALLEQTKAKLRVQVLKPDGGEAETCDGSDDPAALESLESPESPESPQQAPDADPPALKARRLVDEATLRTRIAALLPRIGQLRDEAQRRDHAARLLKLKQAAADLGTLNDAAAVQAIAAMFAKLAEQQAQLDAAVPAPAGRAPAKAATPRPAKQGPRKRDLSDPAFAREVMALLTPEERARVKTKADYEWAIQNYDAVMAVRAKLGPMPERLVLTLPKLDPRSPDLVAEQAHARAQFYADKKFLRGVFTARGLDAKEIDGLDENQVKALMWQFAEAERLAASPLANDGLGDSKGPVNHFLDGVEDGVGKVAHDIGNIGLAAKATYDIVTGDELPEEPHWFGAAGRTRGQNLSAGALLWELAGNVPIIGRAQLLHGATELVRGAWNGDWNNVAYGLGNLTGSAMAGGAMGKLPLKQGKFADTRLGRTVESGRSRLFGESPAPTRPRTNPAHLLPHGDGTHTHVDVPSHAPGAPYSSRTPGGLQVEVQPHLVGSADTVQPDLANRMHAAAKAVEGVLPKGRRIATPEGRPLAIVVDPTQPVPYMDRASGTVHMSPGLDPNAPFPTKGPGAALARWAPRRGEATPTEIVMQHELGHAAMPEIGARIGALGKRKLTRAIMQRMGLTNTPEARLTDARLAREEMLVHGLDELGADTIAVAAAKDLQATPKSIAHGLAQALDAHAEDPSQPLPPEFPGNPVEWMRRRDFSDGGTIPRVDELVTPYDVFSGVRRHLGKHYGDALTGQKAPQVIAALLATNERFMQKLDAEPALLDGDYVSANALFIALFDAEAAKLGLATQKRRPVPA
jgi:hypothetical protein